MARLAPEVDGAAFNFPTGPDRIELVEAALQLLGRGSIELCASTGGHSPHSGSDGWSELLGLVP
jgi:hypothetical protein